MPRFICDVEHGKLGMLAVSETSNGARVYAKSEEYGVLQFQSAKQQVELRSLVIAAGFGDELTRKPSALETANFAPERVPEVSTSVPGENAGHESVTVADVVQTTAPEAIPESAADEEAEFWR